MTLAWKNAPQLKAKTIDALKLDREKDAFIQGEYLRDRGLDISELGFRGCAVGCVVQANRGLIRDGDWHKIVEDDLAIPEVIAYLSDAIFEGLPTENNEHAKFAVECYDAIPVGADLSLVSAHFMLDILRDRRHGVLRHAGDQQDVRDATESVASLYERRIAGDEPSESEWRAAADAAYAAADAARAAADAAYAAARATYAAARAARATYADYAAADAAYAAADAARAAYAEHYKWMAQRLIHHLSSAPMPAGAAQ